MKMVRRVVLGLIYPTWSRNGGLEDRKAGNAANS